MSNTLALRGHMFKSRFFFVKTSLAPHFHCRSPKTIQNDVTNTHLVKLSVPLLMFHQFCPVFIHFGPSFWFNHWQRQSRNSIASSPWAFGKCLAPKPWGLKGWTVGPYCWVQCGTFLLNVATIRWMVFFCWLGGCLWNAVFLFCWKNFQMFIHVVVKSANCNTNGRFNVSFFWFCHYSFGIKTRRSLFWPSFLGKHVHIWLPIYI